MPIRKLALLVFLAPATHLLAAPAPAPDDQELEEVVVVGGQIKGANITEVLAVSVITAEDIDILGVDSGDGLLQLIPENGQNFFNEAENISGGVNSARGDTGAFNLRNIGTGNTLALLNGRRMVNAATFQTEQVGGSFVPVNTVNTNAIPVYGVERVEVLRDGASAIYGTDAVAGVVNTVLDDDYEGLRLRLRHSGYENFDRNDQKLTLHWGTALEGGDTHVTVFFEFYNRGRVNSQDDDRWANSDFRYRLNADSPFRGSFRNNSANSLYGQFDVATSLAGSHSLRTGDVTDNAGEFEVFPLGHPNCEYTINEQVCGAEDGNGTYRYNLNENRDLVSDLQRKSFFISTTHSLNDNLEAFNEFSGYLSDTDTNRQPSAPFSSVKLEVGAQNYYNPFGPRLLADGSANPNRLPDSVIGTDVPDEGLTLIIDNYRFAEVPRIVVNNGETWRLLHGWRGTLAGRWDWETAVLWSRSKKTDVTHNRVSNTLAQEALNDPTPAAYNPFSGGVNSNIERLLVSVYRESQAQLLSYDLKLSTNDLYALPYGSVAGLFGVELRRESYEDDRDPRLDGSVNFVDRDGDTFPLVSDVVNSSPTPDGSGRREVASLFGELQVPVLPGLDAQLALRFEDFSDVGSTTVSKIAAGWRPFEFDTAANINPDALLLRGSWSQTFRAPNLITINERIVARSNTRTDWVCEYVDPDETELDCQQLIQRTAQGASNLAPEEGENFSVGVVLEDPWFDSGLVLTVDYWSIEKNDTIGLFGEENHTLLDLLLRIEQGDGNCSALSVNPAVERDTPPAAADPAAALYAAAGICPAGELLRVNDVYANLDTRTVTGYDIGFYMDWDFQDLGQLNLKLNVSLLDKYEQKAGAGASAQLVAAQQAGTLPANFPIAGFADLINRDGNQDYKHLMTLRHKYADFSTSLTWYRLGSFYQSSLTRADGTRWVVPAFNTYDATFTWSTDVGVARTRWRLGVRNLTDERAPLADRFFGFFADAHSDYGRSYYLDLRIDM